MSSISSLITRRLIPESLRLRILSSGGLQRLRPGHRMMVGIGRGLRFEAGPSNHAYASGDNELPVQEALARSVRAGSVFYDIGANVGFLTTIGAKLVGPTGKVYAFEPVPANAAYVRLNSKLNGFEQTVVFQQAVSAASGRSTLTLAAYSGGAALSNVPAPPDAVNSIEVPVVCVDDLVFAQSLPAPNVVKIDVEGAELDVLKGMNRTISEHHPVIIYEIDDAMRANFDDKYEACKEFLEERGYCVERLPDSYVDTTWIVGHAIAVPAKS